MPGTVSSILDAVPFSFHDNPMKKAPLLSLLYMRKLRPRKVNQFIQGHAGSRRTKIETWVYVTPKSAHVPLSHHVSIS